MCVNVCSYVVTGDMQRQPPIHYSRIHNSYLPPRDRYNQSPPTAGKYPSHPECTFRLETQSNVTGLNLPCFCCWNCASMFIYRGIISDRGDVLVCTWDLSI